MHHLIKYEIVHVHVSKRHNGSRNGDFHAKVFIKLYDDNNENKSRRTFGKNWKETEGNVRNGIEEEKDDGD